MTRVVSRARRIYTENGIWLLIKKSVNYLFRNYIWKVIPKEKTLRLISQSRILTSTYFLLKGTFYEEQRSVLCGIAKYHENEEGRKDPRHRLIRSVHRIEKGLSMRDRRNVFAEGYITDTISDLEVAWEKGISDKQLYWAVDVLNEYFEVVDKTDKISTAKKRFSEFLDQISYTPDGRVPFPRKELGDSPIDYNELKQLATQRTSTRWFQEKTVPRDLIDQAVDVATQSPSACNRQSYEFRFYDDPELIDEISSLAIGASGYNDNVPCLGVIVGKQRAYFNDRDKHVIYIDASLAAMALQFAFETQGVASCCINWPSIPNLDRKMSKKLNLEPDEEVIMLMAIGYPDPNGMIPYSEKKPVESVRSFNKL